MMDVPNKQRVTPMGIGLGFIFLFVITLLLLPSSKAKRIAKAKESFERNYTQIGPIAIQPLFGKELVANGNLVSFSQSDQFAVLIFSPSPGTNGSAAMINEICNSMTNFDPRKRGLRYGVLFAPDPSSTGWTLLSKVWIAQGIQKRPIGELRNLALALVGTKSASFSKLEAIWAGTPVEVRHRSESMLKSNLEVVKHFKPNTRIFHHSKGMTYSISGGRTISDFLAGFYSAYPESMPADAP